MAQGLLQSALPSLTVQSAGLGALVGMPADPKAITLLAERRIDISAHRARQLTSEMCLQADIVLAMDQLQRSRIELMYPFARGRVFKVGEFTKQDVPDPYRRSDLAFRNALRLIEDGVNEWTARIERL